MRLFYLCFFLVNFISIQADLSDIELFNSLIPSKFQEFEEVLKLNHRRLYANKYDTVEELVEGLIGDVEYVRNFNLSKPFNYNFEDIENCENATVNILTEQLISELYIKLWRVFNEFSKMFEIIEQMTEEDYIAVYDHIYKDSVSVESIEFENDQMIQAFVPFIENDELIESQGIKKLIKILTFPIKIVKLIGKLFWKLASIKKLIKLAENKVCLTIILLIQKICKEISEIKKKLSYKYQLILWSIKSGDLFKKILSIFLLIIKKLKILSWILNDLLYRYKWKLIFLLKSSEKKSFLIAIYFKELVYGKLGLMTREQKKYLDFINYDDDYYNWDDYNYYEEFNNLVYSKPGVYKSEDPEFQKVLDILENNKKVDKEKDEMFDSDEEFGFNNINLSLKKYKNYKEFDVKTN